MCEASNSVYTVFTPDLNTFGNVILKSSTRFARPVLRLELLLNYILTILFIGWPSDKSRSFRGHFLLPGDGMARFS